MLSLQTAKSSALIGVLISVTTIPAAANVGVAAAYRDWDEWRGAALQLAINLSMIVVAGVATLAVARWRHAPQTGPAGGRQGTVKIVIGNVAPASRGSERRGRPRRTGACETSSSL